MAKFYHKTAGLQQVSQHLLLAQIVSLHCHITSGLQGGGKTDRKSIRTMQAGQHLLFIQMVQRAR